MTWMGRLSSVLNQKFGALRLSSSASIVHAETLDRGQDIIDRFGPTERLWIGVVVFDECGDSIIPLPARLALSIARSTAAAIAPLPFTAAGGSAGDLGLVCGTRPDNRAAFYEGLHELSDGLPVSMMLVGKYWDEPPIYRAAYAFERAGDWREL